MHITHSSLALSRSVLLHQPIQDGKKEVAFVIVAEGKGAPRRPVAIEASGEGDFSLAVGSDNADRISQGILNKDPAPRTRAENHMIGRTGREPESLLHTA